MSEIASKIREKFSTAVIGQTEFRGELTLDITFEILHDVCAYCRDGLGFDYLIDASGLDHLGESPRFEMVYELYSMKDGVHLRLKSKLPDEADPVAPTVSDLWPTADWHEREAYDMMGIKFSGHPDLRRILMWEGYPYFPLRKDFPLQGKPSDINEVAFTEVAPLAGGPFVTAPTPDTTIEREPRARHVGEEPPPEVNRTVQP